MDATFDARPTQTFTVGDQVRVKVTFKSAGAVVDPTTVIFTYKSVLIGTLNTFTYGIGANVVKVSTGIYYIDINTTPADGIWQWTATSTGTGAAAITGSFTARTTALIGTITVTPGTVADIGLVTHIGSQSYVARTIVATSASIVVTNGSGLLGNPSIDTVQNIQTTATPRFLRLGLGAAADSTAQLNVNGTTMGGSATGIGVNMGATTISEKLHVKAGHIAIQLDTDDNAKGIKWYTASDYPTFKHQVLFCTACDPALRSPRNTLCCCCSTHLLTKPIPSRDTTTSHHRRPIQVLIIRRVLPNQRDLIVGLPSRRWIGGWVENQT